MYRTLIISFLKEPTYCYSIDKHCRHRNCSKKIRTSETKGVPMKNMFKLLIITLSLFAVSSIFAAEKSNELHKDKKELRQDIKNQHHTRNFKKELNTAVDLWYEANLKGDNKRIRHCERNVYRLIKEDIKNSYRLIYQTKKEYHQTKKDYNDNKSNQRALRDDSKDTIAAKNLVKAKKRLFNKLKKGGSFDYKYCLLGDYLQLLRHQQKLTRMELAEDVHEFHQDQKK